MSNHHRWLAAFGFTLITLAAPVAAQQGPPDGVSMGTAVAAANIAAPVPAPILFPVSERDVLGLDIMPIETAAPFMMTVPPQASEKSNVALMIVGGAALVVGSLIDGDTGTIVMVSGAAVGLLGLYRYLR